jgi:hypothetical protein
MKNDLPVLTKRISQVVQYYTNGNVKAFAEKLSNISQQRLDRIFKIDKRTGKYPSVSDDILIEISKCFPKVNLYWLLAGKGQMLNNQEIPQDNISEKDKIIDWLNRELDEKRKIIDYLIADTELKRSEIKRLMKELDMIRAELQKKEPVQK